MKTKQKKATTSRSFLQGVAQQINQSNAMVGFFFLRAGIKSKKMQYNSRPDLFLVQENEGVAASPNPFPIILMPGLPSNTA
jgi:hypothetical protein